MKQEELAKIHAQHRLWLQSRQKPLPQGRRANFSHLDLAHLDLRHLDLRRAIFIGANLSHIQASHCRFDHVDFSGANLYGAQLDHGSFSFANLTESDLSTADLSHANLSHSQLVKADLSQSCLVASNLFGANLTLADLHQSTVDGADMRDVNLEQCTVAGVQYDRLGKYLGIRANNCLGNPAFKRFVLDQEYLEDFQARHPLMYTAWWISTDCGRSFSRIASWALAIMLCFAGIYLHLGSAAFVLAKEGLAWGYITMFYYSVVTFTTLGFGDITPKTHLAAAWVMAEVVISYIVLGLLISIMANKVGRRS